LQGEFDRLHKSLGHLQEKDDEQEAQLPGASGSLKKARVKS
jgi:hypothetical protein